jgi:hypothetical protein
MSAHGADEKHGRSGTERRCADRAVSQQAGQLLDCFGADLLDEPHQFDDLFVRKTPQLVQRHFSTPHGNGVKEASEGPRGDSHQSQSAQRPKQTGQHPGTQWYTRSAIDPGQQSGHARARCGLDGPVEHGPVPKAFTVKGIVELV